MVKWLTNSLEFKRYGFDSHSRHNISHFHHTHDKVLINTSTCIINVGEGGDVQDLNTVDAYPFGPDAVAELVERSFLCGR